MRTLEKSPRRLSTCDRCGFTFRKNILRRQSGLLLCNACYDNPSATSKTPSLYSPRITTTPLDPVYSPIIFTIDGSGVTAVGQSQSFKNEGPKRVFTMYIVGSGPTTVIGVPAIVAGLDKDRLALIGTSDINYVTFTDGNGISLMGGSSCTLKYNDTIQFTYDISASVWRETSRTSF